MPGTNQQDYLQSLIERKEAIQSDYLQAVETKNEYERIEAEIMLAKRNAYHADLKPFVEGDTYAVFHNALLAIKDRNEADNMFNYTVETLLTNLQFLNNAVAQYQPPIPSSMMPTPLPITPAPEGSTNGE